MPHRFLKILFLAAGGWTVAILLRRRAANSRERADLYYDDGSMVSLAEGTAEAERLLPLARNVLQAGR